MARTFHHTPAKYRDETIIIDPFRQMTSYGLSLVRLHNRQDRQAVRTELRSVRTRKDAERVAPAPARPRGRARYAQH